MNALVVAHFEAEFTVEICLGDVELNAINISTLILCKCVNVESALTGIVVTHVFENISLNLAQVISDEEQIMILTMEEAEAKARMEREQQAGIVNLNTASKEQLMTLPGIGESRAEDIIRYRKESGGFQSVEEIMNVPGIKESAYLKIKDSITV